MSRTKRTALAAAVTMVGASLLASKATADDRDICVKETGDVAIAACTRAITSGQYSGERLAKIYQYRCARYLVKSDYKLAISDCSTAVEISPNFETFLDRGNVQMDFKQYDRAGTDYTAAIKLNPKSPFAWFNRCRFNIMQNKT
jgi:tetratricopeptide (TPR) repeat protein